MTEVASAHQRLGGLVILRHEVNKSPRQVTCLYYDSTLNKTCPIDCYRPAWYGTHVQSLEAAQTVRLAGQTNIIKIIVHLVIEIHGDLCGLYKIDS